MKSRLGAFNKAYNMKHAVKTVLQCNHGFFSVVGTSRDDISRY